MSLLPLPQSPEAYQVSTTSKSARGTSASSPGVSVPSNSQCAASEPLENSQRPLKRNPESHGSFCTRLLTNEREHSTSGPSEKKSSWARSGKCPTIQAWTVQSE